MAYTIKIETNDAIKSIESLKKQVDKLKASLANMDKSSSSYNKALKKLAIAEKELADAQKTSAKSMKDLGNAAQSSSKSVKDSANHTKKAVDNFKAMRDEIRRLRSDLYGTTEGTAEYNEALTKLANKMRDFNDMNQAVRASAKDLGQMIGNTIGTMNGFVGAFAAISGSIELFGGDAEWVQKLESKSLSLIKVLQGLSAVEDGFTKKWPQLKAQLQAMNAQWADSIKQRQLAKTATEAQIAVEASSAAQTAALTGNQTALNTAQTAGAAAQGALAAQVTNSANVQAKYNTELANTNTLLSMSDLDTLKMKYKALSDQMEHLWGLQNGSITPDLEMGEEIKSAKQLQMEYNQLYRERQTVGYQIKGLRKSTEDASKASVAAFGKVGKGFKGMMRGIKAAMVSNPLGALLTIVTTLITVLPTVIGWFKKLGGGISDAERQAQNFNRQLDAMSSRTEFEIKIKMKYEGWSEADAEKARLDTYKAMRERLSLELKKAQGELEKIQQDMAIRLAETQGVVDINVANKLKLAQSIVTQFENRLEELNSKIATSESLWSNLQTSETVDRWKKEEQERQKLALELDESALSEREKLERTHHENMAKLQTMWDNGEIDSLERKNELIEKETRRHNKAIASQNGSGSGTTTTTATTTLPDNSELQSKLDSLLGDLETWKQKADESLKEPYQVVIDQYNQELDILEESHDKALINEKEFYEAKTKLDAKYAESLRIALFDQTQAEVKALEESNQAYMDLAQSNYSVKINKAGLGGDRVKAAQLAIEMEDKLFKTEKQLLENEAKLWQDFADKCVDGSKEQVEALQNVAKAQHELTIATNNHTIAQDNNNEAKDEALTATVSLHDALKEYLNLDTKAANTLENSLNLASQVSSEVGNLISLYADEAQARSENEKLTEQERAKSFQQYKNLQIAQATISYLEGVVQAWSTAMTMKPVSLVLPTGFALTGLLTAQYAKQIQAIKSTTQDNNTTGTTSSSGSASVAAPKYTTAEANIEAARPLSDTRVYVLESDITSVQNKNLVRVKDSTF